MIINYWLILFAIGLLFLYLEQERVYSNRAKENINLEKIIKTIGISLYVTAIIFASIAWIVSFFILKDGTIAGWSFSILVALGAGGLFIYEDIREKQRREILSNWAKYRGWTITFDRDRTMHRRYDDFYGRFNNGSNRYSYNILKGEWRRYSAEAFSFHYQITNHGKSGSTTTDYYFQVFLIHLEKQFPELAINSREFWTLGGIDFESIEFCERFKVRCRDLRFAYDFCHPRMMEYLLTKTNINLGIQGNALAFFIKKDELIPEDIEVSLDLLVKLRELMPNYLFGN